MKKYIFILFTSLILSSCAAKRSLVSEGIFLFRDFDVNMDVLQKSVEAELKESTIEYTINKKNNSIVIEGSTEKSTIPVMSSKWGGLKLTDIYTITISKNNLNSSKFHIKSRPKVTAGFIPQLGSDYSSEMMRTLLDNIRRRIKYNTVAAIVPQNSTYKTSITTFSTPQLIKNRTKIALVIGNSNYKNGYLKNPKNDASDIANALKKLGFNVILEIDANQERMDLALSKFGRSLTDDSIGLFYYAGHGVQINGSNFLIPINAKIQSSHDVKYKALNLGVVADEMHNAKTELNIIIIDACRNNPLPKSARSSSRGLARIDSPNGTILVYATSPGSTASDGTGRNGLFSKHLLQHMYNPNMPIEKLIKQVSKGVQQESHSKQIPWMESSFTGDFYFKPNASTP